MPSAPARRERLETQGYSFKALTTVWQRLTYRPASNATSVIHTRPVRSFRTLPVSSIKLNDMMENRLTTPFTLREFDDYLVHKAYASQNLYFLLWHKSYTAAFSAHYGTNASEPHALQDLPPDKAASFTKALQHFIQPGPMQLNLDHCVRSALLLDAAHCANPSIMLQALHSAEDMLAESLRAFVTDNLGNSDTNRSRFAIIVGILSVFLGLGCFIAFLFLRLSRAYRLLVLPLYFAGTLTAVGGYKKTCLIIWLFGGNVRQLKSWELARPKAAKRPAPKSSFSSPDIRPVLRMSSSFRTEKTDYSIEPKHEKSESYVEHNGERSRSESVSDSTSWSMDWDSVLGSPQMRSDGDLEAASPAKPASSPSAPVFGPLTKISSPFVILSQRHIMLTGALYGAWCTVILGAVTLSVPNAP